jgi:hypothetical protein
MRTQSTFNLAWRLFAIALFTVVPGVFGATIVSVTGPASDGLGVDGGIQILEASWTAGASYSNVSVAAQVRGIATGAGSIAAYLTTVVGPAETAADLIAATTVTPLTGDENDTLFSGLNLGPGTYYLVLSGLGEDGAVGWWGTTSPTVAVGTSVSLDSDGISQGTGLNSGNPPASGFSILTGSELLFQVTGNAAIATPEPGSMSLIGVGCLLAGMGLWVHRRRRTDARR